MDINLSPLAAGLIDSELATRLRRAVGFRNLAVHSPAALSESLGDAFPWMDFLPAADRRLFVDEFTRVVIAAAALDNYEPLTQVVREWRATAEVHADPKLAKRLRKSIEEAGVPVAVPAP